MTRRPATITGIGWLLIVVGAAGLLKDVLPLFTADDPRRLATLKSDGLGDLGATWTSRLLAIIGGAGLLRGRNRAR